MRFRLPTVEVQPLQGENQVCAAVTVIILSNDI